MNKVLSAVARLGCFFFGHSWKGFEAAPPTYLKADLVESTLLLTCLTCSAQTISVRLKPMILEAPIGKVECRGEVAL